MNCKVCGCKTTIELPCGNAAYTGGGTGSTRRITSRSDSYYQCVDCGHVEHVHRESDVTLKVTRRFTKYGGWIEETEVAEGQPQ